MLERSHRLEVSTACWNSFNSIWRIHSSAKQLFPYEVSLPCEASFLPTLFSLFTMKLIDSPTNKASILSNHNHFFKTMIKAVVDVDKKIMAIDGELHADLENLLLQERSEQEHLWGINLFLDKGKRGWIEYTALINIRPSMGNQSMEVENLDLRQKITEIVHKLITE